MSRGGRTARLASTARKKKTRAMPGFPAKKTAGGLALAQGRETACGLAVMHNACQADLGFLPVIHHHQRVLAVSSPDVVHDSSMYTTRSRALSTPASKIYQLHLEHEERVGRNDPGYPRSP